MRYKWLEGSCLTDYNQNALLWKNHTSTSKFVADFAAIL
jgi:hypothetical protein